MRLRPARGEDALIIFEWVMDYETRRNATNSKSFSLPSSIPFSLILEKHLRDAIFKFELDGVLTLITFILIGRFGA